MCLCITVQTVFFFMKSLCTYSAAVYVSENILQSDLWPPSCPFLVESECMPGYRHCIKPSLSYVDFPFISLRSSVYHLPPPSRPRARDGPILCLLSKVYNMTMCIPEDGSVTADVIPDVPVDPLIRKCLLVLPVVSDTCLPAV